MGSNWDRERQGNGGKWTLVKGSELKYYMPGTQYICNFTVTQLKMRGVLSFKFSNIGTLSVFSLEISF